MIDPHARANASLTILKWQLVVVERNKIEREKDERRKKKYYQQIITVTERILRRILQLTRIFA